MPENDYATGTYFTLRSMLIILVLLLAASIGLHLLAHGGCLQDSVSGYYYTSAQAMFVGMLCAIGACLIIHQGADVENALLDFSGFMAFVVAFVPAEVDNTCQVGDLVGIQTTAEVRTTLPPVLAAAIVAGIWAVVKRKRGEATGWAAAVRLATLAVVVIMAFWALLSPPGFVAHGHLSAAVLMFAGMVLVVGWNYWDTSGARYGWVFWAMMVTLVIWLAFLVFSPIPHLTLIVEAVLIAEFAGFWMRQTGEFREGANRPERISRVGAAA
ncbi:hypothetical protein [Amycolatopsis sp. DG1A-15b]|uniref:hypothetical protein n=1 Tax=Amycolatopsis sp. DG1A-15b TaxID=3052846 RepID=UPI00255BD547|nr:hypothetical protein [Amycolatopsis sp. DG1A-15b]WIX88823.1 hypothetical protein QRY02_48265 [Amycolatopsis sp. DG1A-15b]